MFEDGNKQLNPTYDSAQNLLFTAVGSTTTLETALLIHKTTVFSVGHDLQEVTAA